MPGAAWERLEGLAQTKLVDALGACRQNVISAQTQVKVAGPVYNASEMVTSAIDALAQLITGAPYYFHAEPTRGTPARDRQQQPDLANAPASQPSRDVRD